VVYARVTKKAGLTGRSLDQMRTATLTTVVLEKHSNQPFSALVYVYANASVLNSQGEGLLLITCLICESFYCLKFECKCINYRKFGHVC